ncbi:MAG TPA: MraY family glycosyltransferase [Nitrospiraceae bacterium]|nr:MraY family glycosyltransferase [Nitrospiraceae bacterium]
MKSVELDQALPTPTSTFQWTGSSSLFGLMFTALLLIPTVQGWFIEQGEQWLYILLLAFWTSFTLTPIAAWAGRRWGLVDVPAARKIHRHATPRTGGVAVYLALVLALLMNSILTEWMAALLIAGSLLFLVGLFDDAREVPAGVKLSSHILAAALVMASGKVLTLFPSSPMGDTANLALTLVWIVGITSAFNFFDGMDGLAAGLAVLIAGFMGFVAFDTDQAGLGWLAVGIVGACLGFLPYNFGPGRPAVVFLGDCGSTFLGFTLACLAVTGHWADQNPIVSFSNPLLIFGALIYDMVHITIARIATGKVTSLRSWLEYVGKDHLHHRLERVLGSRVASVLLIYSLTISLGIAAIVLRKADTTEALLLLAQATMIILMVTVLEQRGGR